MFFTSCEVEFSPNASWKEIPVIYCVLDQDDVTAGDTTWVRVERCYLGDGSIYTYSSISDSINYPQGSIDVRILVYRNGACIDSIQCRDTLREREQGDFASHQQPIYYTTQRLQDDCYYKVEVRRAGSRSLMAYTDSIPLITCSTNVIRKPYNTEIFGFFDRTSGNVPSFLMEWYAMDNARRYQPFVRFYYGEDGDTNYVDVLGGSVNSGNGSTILSTSLTRDGFLKNLELQLQNDTNPKRYLKLVDVYLTACDENLNNYISTVNSGSSIDQSTHSYTNVHCCTDGTVVDGVGILAARRTHIYKTLEADASMVPNVGFYWFLLNKIDAHFGEE
ncbi:MAG: hypothetical protein IKX32_02405 [Bacteroidales bacterium]|nr:hypothetical protein [Bacteroidales bacterium]